jgi:hypothetical protein
MKRKNTTNKMIFAVLAAGAVAFLAGSADGQTPRVNPATGLLQASPAQPGVMDPNPGLPVSRPAPLTPQGATGVVNLPFKNPGMEEGSDSPVGWQKGREVAGVELIWDHAIAHGGKASLCMKKTAQRYYPIAEWGQELAVEPADHPRKLRVQCWIKAENVTKAIVDVSYTTARDEHAWAIYIGPKSDSDPLATYDWKLCEGTVELPRNTSKVGIAFQIYGPGTIWFDDVSATWDDSL